MKKLIHLTIALVSATALTTAGFAARGGGGDRAAASTPAVPPAAPVPQNPLPPLPPTTEPSDPADPSTDNTTTQTTPQNKQGKTYTAGQTAGIAVGAGVAGLAVGATSMAMLNKRKRHISQGEGNIQYVSSPSEYYHHNPKNPHDTFHNQPKNAYDDFPPQVLSYVPLPIPSLRDSAEPEERNHAEGSHSPLPPVAVSPANHTEYYQDLQRQQKDKQNLQQEHHNNIDRIIQEHYTDKQNLSHNTQIIVTAMETHAKNSDLAGLNQVKEQDGYKEKAHQDLHRKLMDAVYTHQQKLEERGLRE